MAIKYSSPTGHAFNIENAKNDSKYSIHPTKE
jgi:hypothetical protein